MPKKVSKTYHKNVNAKDVRIWRKWQKRTKVLALAGLVVVAGVGGYFAYRSFAATPTFPYTVANQTLKPWTGSLVVNSSSKTKSSPQVLSMPSGSQAIVTSPAAQITILANQPFMECVTVSGIDAPWTGPSMNVVSSGNHNTESGIPLSRDDRNYTDLGDGYTEYCGDRTVFNYKYEGPLALTYNKSKATPAPTITVQAFTIKFVN